MNFFTLGADCGQFQCDIFLTWHCAQTHFKYFIIDLFNSVCFNKKVLRNIYHYDKMKYRHCISSELAFILRQINLFVFVPLQSFQRQKSV